VEHGAPYLAKLPDDIDDALAEGLYGKHLPVIAMTAHAMGEDRGRCTPAGMGAYTRPFQPDKLASSPESLIFSPQALYNAQEALQRPKEDLPH